MSKSDITLKDVIEAFPDTQYHRPWRRIGGDDLMMYASSPTTAIRLSMTKVSDGLWKASCVIFQHGDVSANAVREKGVSAPINFDVYGKRWPLVLLSDAVERGKDWLDERRGGLDLVACAL